jgi:hypothetical protein
MHAAVQWLRSKQQSFVVHCLATTESSAIEATHCSYDGKLEISRSVILVQDKPSCSLRIARGELNRSLVGQSFCQSLSSLQLVSVGLL